MKKNEKNFPPILIQFSKKIPKKEKYLSKRKGEKKEMKKITRCLVVVGKELELHSLKRYL